MILLDYCILIGFMVWLLVIGAIFSRQVKSSADMYSAGSESPWWIAGLSGFMTIFSAGTFVMWGGIAFNSGLVATSLLMVTGLSAVAVGFNVAGRWRTMGIATPTEYHRIRFNEQVVQAYTWLGFLFRGIGLAVGFYALAKMLSALVPLPEGAPFRDPATGNLSEVWSTLIWGAVVIAYTMAGGLWAVMMTDVIQCIVLCLLVLITVPLALSKIGGFDVLWEQAPENFFSPVSAEFPYEYLLLWFLLGFFRYAADWAFVQRYTCVPTPQDARKTAYLMGGLYVISPFLWMLPAMAYRLVDPEADKEQAYVYMCQAVLPAGMLGIMMAAMFSATASMVSSILNVFAAVFTCDVYRPWVNPQASESQLVWVGRLATLLYGALIVGLALLVPHLGGAKAVVIPLVTVMMGPMYLPVIWGLYSKYISAKAVWATLGTCAVVSGSIKLTLMQDSLPSVLSGTPVAAALEWMADNIRMTDALLGLALPVGVLLLMELVGRRRGVDAGYQRMQQALDSHQQRPITKAKSKLPLLIIAATLTMLGVVMGIIASWTSEDRTTVVVFAALLLAVAAGVGWYARKPPKQTDQQLPT